MIGVFASRFLLVLLVTSSAMLGMGYATRALFFKAPQETYYVRGVGLEVPRNWKCDLDGTELVCNPAVPPPYDAIIIVATKTADSTDTLDAYVAHLSKPQEFRTKEGEAALSEILSVDRIAYGSQTWIDGVHRGSEVPNFDTRYLATIIGSTAVLITFSCHRNACAGYQPVLSRFVQSFKIRGAS